jgi:hypothetical protein
MIWRGWEFIDVNEQDDDEAAKTRLRETESQAAGTKGPMFEVETQE